ncbi:NAD(P)H-dependent oxidoreductase [Cohnella abietis]|uniref:NAD(P)H oxidoreductase n=1 Tax=Cohnella abietis TaxID=2507935 RepID=A0A3T1D463_9BACL|nr:NAD(P)H-dependent oxidoreductase [Cohnella abietis]BBI32809.1 NAD(P)H oxidoreductase [Cohnella abietis]
MKTLIVAAHPTIESSFIHKRWLEELRKYPEEFTVHELYKEYPDEKIDVKREQELVDAHDHLILQFPIFWFNSPPFLKKWLDDVFLSGWAFGKGGDKLKDKKISFAVSAGIKSEDFSSTGKYKYTLEEILRPFEVTCHYIEADYRPFYAFYGAEHNPSVEEVGVSAEEYVQFVRSL